VSSDVNAFAVLLFDDVVVVNRKIFFPLSLYSTTKHRTRMEEEEDIKKKQN